MLSHILQKPVVEQDEERDGVEVLAACQTCPMTPCVQPTGQHFMGDMDPITATFTENAPKQKAR